jgi:hypothetical protein
MNSFGDMCENRILTLPHFLPQRVKRVNFLRRHPLAMDLSYDIYEKCRCAICRFLDIAIYVCTYPKC